MIFPNKITRKKLFSTRRTGRNSEEVEAKMATLRGYSDVIFLRGGHLSCHLLRKAPRTCQSDFNDLNKNLLQKSYNLKVNLDELLTLIELYSKFPNLHKRKHVQDK